MTLIRTRALRARRAFAVAVTATATLAAAACGSSGSKPDSQAADTASATQAAAKTPPGKPPQTFLSHRYNFRVTLTDGWSHADARVDWNGKKLQGLDSVAFANFTQARTGRTLAAAAARVPKGLGLAEWRAAMVRAAPSFCTESSSVVDETFGGEPALAWTAKCSDGYHVNKLAALHGTRGYMILLASPTANHPADNRRVFESMRRSFRFTR